MRIVRLAVLGLCAASLATVSNATESETTVSNAPESEKMGGATPTVARAVITNAIQDREPVDKVSALENDQPIIYFFTELQNLGGATVTHRWTLDGKVMAEVPFTVDSPRWRVWSSKNLEPSWTGEWKVSVLDREGTVLETAEFTYSPVGTKAVAPPAKPSP